MDLQTLSGKAVTSENTFSAKNFRPYSPQTADKIRPQPDTPGEQFGFTRHRTTTSNPDDSDPGGHRGLARHLLQANMFRASPAVSAPKVLARQILRDAVCGRSTCSNDAPVGSKWSLVTPTSSTSGHCQRGR
jgi:hypothetical protein